MNERLIDDRSLTLATSSSVVSRAMYRNTERAVITITHTGTAGETISLAFGKDAKANQGIVLKQGDIYSASKDSGYIPPSDMITAIASAATATIAIHEEIDLI